MGLHKQTRYYNVATIIVFEKKTFGVIMSQNRTRLSKDSIATIKRATSAKVKKTEQGSFEVTVCKDRASYVLTDGDGTAMYDTVTAAKQAVRRHNPSISFPQQDGKPAPGFE